MSKSRSRQPLIRKFLARGASYQREGRAESADECYRNALKVDPCCAEALRLRGVIALEAGRYRESTGLLSAALALDPDDAVALNSLAESHRGQGEGEQALRYYRRVAELRPQSSEAHTNLGQTEELFGDLAAAANSYRRALELQPDSAEANCKLAHILRRLRDFPEALRLSERALTLGPARFETYNELGLILTDMNDLRAAAEAFRRSVALNPNSALTALTQSYFFLKCGDIPASADSLRRAIELNPTEHLSHLSLGSVLSMMGDFAGAQKCYERARSLCPTSADVIFYLGLLHLSQGNFALGWDEYEERAEARRARRTFSQPQWKGEPLQGARIVLHAEQGLGDTLQAIRYVPLVAARGGQAVLAVQARLHRLLAGTEGAWQVISDGGTVSDVRWHCPLLSLPRALGTDLSTIPAKIPYVHPDPALVKVWEHRMRGNSLRIGLAWGGDPKHPQNWRRSIPLEQLAPLTHLEGTTFYSLQMGPPAGQIKQLGPRVHLVDLQDEQKDFADTAAIVANLDLVISIDTSVVHLAGAMGKPVWVLLNNSPDWRWLLEREDSPWYPTARLFRQSTMGNWQEVVTRVDRELRALVAKTAPAQRNEPYKGEKMNMLNVAPPYCLVLSRHGWMLANVNDIYMGAAIATYGECNELELAVLLALAQYPGLVVEVGANMGIHTVPMALALQAQGRQLVAFEPQPVVFQQLCANLALNGLMNVTAWPFACGEEQGVVTFPRPEYRKTGNFGGVSMSSSAPVAGNASVQVPCIRLDDLLQRERVGLLKIDVEGFELRVLKGSSALIKRSRPLLYVENDRVEHSRELIEWLWGIGYNLWWHTPPLFNPHNFFGVAKNLYGRIASFNMLGVPREVDLAIPAQLIRVEDSSYHPLRPLPPTLIAATGKSLDPTRLGSK